uniref:Cadherin-5 n=1 Tax=Sphenodon punctatus TaxID=8508 RepID=A0A8D0G7V6_SPHPU
MESLVLLVSSLLALVSAQQEDLKTHLNLSVNKNIHKRMRRDWIWNQMHIMEERIDQLPHHVGKLVSSIRNENAKYVLHGEYANSIFKVKEDTGDVYAFERLDREKKAEYELTALIIDKRTNKSLEPPSTFRIKVYDVNDNSPVFVQKVFNGSVPEMSPLGTSVTTVTAVDADDPTVAGYATVVYKVIQGKNFTVSKSGVISTAVANLDREEQSRYEIVVEAKDSQGLHGESSTATVIITLGDINDNPPTFGQKSFHFKVPENIRVGGEVGRLKVEDIDEPQNRNTEYSFVKGDYRDTFKIVAKALTKEGILQPMKPLDYERIKQYKFDIEATDRTVDLRYFKFGVSKSIASVTIYVLDVDEPPVFTFTPYRWAIAENIHPRNPIGSVHASDPDAAKRKIRYTIRRTNPGGDYFKISNNGDISLTKSLDRETSVWYNLTVAAQEIIEGSKLPDIESHAQVYIEVLYRNDNAPEFAEAYSPKVCENAAPGKVIITISATDKDEMLPGVYFKYSLATEDSNFTLIDNHDNSANVTVKYGQFNRELTKIHYLPVIIADNGSPDLSSTNTLSISVCKCNEAGELTFCEEAAAVQVGVGIQALVAIFICILTIIVITLLIVLKKRHKKDLNVLRKNVPEIHEQLVTYDEEGGGEMDTTSYDVSVLNSVRNVGMKPPRLTLETGHPTYAVVQKPTGNGLSGTGEMAIMIEVKKDEADNDGDLLPYDTLHIYGYEGAESIAESLSSLESGSSDSDIDYDFLNDWGPRFKMLAELYALEPNEDPFY